MNGLRLRDYLDVLASAGDEQYHGEPVSQLEHALQAAALAEQSGASRALILAALFHDIGHLVHDEGEDAASRGLDTGHETVGARLLEALNDPELAEPIRLHVAAKRYLCAVEPSYRGSLSSASELSLQLQGGPMTLAEVAAFEANAWYEGAIRLRRWDDEAKVAGLIVPGLDHYRPLVEEYLAARGD